MNIRKSLTLAVILLLSVAAFAQPGGGGGGFGGGRGGNRGGMEWNGGGGRGGFRNAMPNDSTPIIRLGGSLYWETITNNPIRDDDLKNAVGEEQFGKYETARRLFINGDNRVSIGVLLYIPTAIVTVIAAVNHKQDPDLSKKLYITAGALFVPATTFYTLGHARKVKAKKQLDEIADTYNKELEIKEASKRIQFEFAPTAMLTRDNDLFLGAKVNLTF